MRTATVFILGMIVGAGVVSLVNYVSDRSETAQVAADDSVGAPQPQDDGKRSQVPKQAQPAAPVEREPASAPAATPAPETLEPQTDAEWNALIGGMLEWQIDRRTGERLSAAQRQRLVSELARLREASLGLQQPPTNLRDPAEVRERLTRTLTIAQVDAAFRKELGIGVGEFVRQLDADAVEDVPRSSQP